MGPKILWAFVLGTLLGVFLRSFFEIGIFGGAFFALISLTGIAASYLLEKKALLVISVFFACIALGLLRMGAAILERSMSLDEKIGQKVELQGYVYKEPDARESSVRVYVRVDSVGVLFIVPPHTAVSYGDIVKAEGTLQLPEAFETNSGRNFDYPGYLAKDGILYELAFVRELEVVGRGRVDPLKLAAITLKQKYLEGLSLALPEPEAGLAAGITAGDKRGLGDELSKVFRTVGLVHIIVLSGYNIMIVIYGLERLLKWFSAHRYVGFAGSVLVAILFALITGLASASVRAALMAMIAVVGKATGRIYLASRALAIVALGMVLWNPYILAFDPGFQLSILATLGLILFTPLVIRYVRFISPKLGLREIAATTLATQLAVLPLLLYQNGSIPVYSLFANLLALIVVPYAMLFSAIAAVAGLVFQPLALFIAFPAQILLSYVIGVANIFAALPFSSLTLPAFSAFLLIPIYTALFFVAYKKTNREPS